MDDAGASVNSDDLVVNGCTPRQVGKETGLAGFGKILSAYYFGSCLSRMSRTAVADGTFSASC